jgi:hypothetical protein
MSCISLYLKALQKEGDPAPRSSEAAAEIFFHVRPSHSLLHRTECQFGALLG